MTWLPTLFAAEAIPSAIITFVALLMFLQLGVGWELSTLLCGLLTLPWVMKSWVRERVHHLGHLSVQLRVAELLTFLLMVALAFCFDGTAASPWLVFASLFLLCVLSAWHELVAQMFYKQRLRRVQQRFYSGLRMFFSQAAVVLTYGVMIVVVGSLEVFYYNYSQVIARSWSSAVYLLAGVYLLLLLYNVFSLKVSGAPATSLTSLHPYRSLSRTSHLVLHVSLFLLLLPQALMFHTRVLFLMAPQTEGGLATPLQWVGLAQGTVGVIAFSAGLILGHRFLHHPHLSPLTPHPSSLNPSMVLALGLSPAVDWLMTFYPPTNLLWLCVATATAQFCFGYGFHACAPILRALFGHRYEGTIHYLYIPLVTLLMLPAMAASGWLVARLGFARFFMIDALLALPAWGAAAYAFHHLSTLPVAHEK